MQIFIWLVLSHIIKPKHASKAQHALEAKNQINGQITTS